MATAAPLRVRSISISIDPTAHTAVESHKPSPASAIGGDPAGCLSAADIDHIVGAYTSLPAAAFFEWRQGHRHTTELAKHLRGAGLFIVHVRHHWVASQLVDGTWKIWDSAPSRAVRADLRRYAISLGLPAPTFEPAPQQLAGSLECGLFASVFVLLRAAGRPVPGHTFVSLAPLRVLCGDRTAFFSAALRILGLPTQPGLPHPARWAHDPYGRHRATVPTTAAGTDPTPTPSTHHPTPSGSGLEGATREPPAAPPTPTTTTHGPEVVTSGHTGAWWHHASGAERRWLTRLLDAHEAAQGHTTEQAFSCCLGSATLRSAFDGQSRSSAPAAMRRQAARLTAAYGDDCQVVHVLARAGLRIALVGSPTSEGPPTIASGPPATNPRTRRFLARLDATHLRLPDVLLCPDGSTALFVLGATRSTLTLQPGESSVAVYELRRDELDSLERASAQPAPPPDVHELDTQLNALSEAEVARGRWEEAKLLRCPQRALLLPGADLDLLMREALAEATRPCEVLSVAEYTFPACPFLRPLHFGPSAINGHFVLLHVDDRRRCRLYDSLPGYRPGQATAAARALLGPGFEMLPSISLPPQGTNECGFAVVNQARRLLGAPHLDRPQPGELRALHAPTVIRVREAEVTRTAALLEAARASVSPSPAQQPHQVEATTPAEHDWQSISDNDFEAWMMARSPGERISVPWRELPAPNGHPVDTTPVIWTGTVTEPWNQSHRSIIVLWDEELPRRVGLRLAPLPEANLPDPEIAYGVPHVMVPTTPPTPTAPPMASTPPPALLTNFAPPHISAQDRTGHALPHAALNSAPPPTIRARNPASAPALHSSTYLPAVPTIARPQPTVKVVSRGKVRAFLRTAPPGTAVRVDFAKGENFFACLGVVRSRAAGSATLQLLRTQCQLCQGWSDEEPDDIHLTLPEEDCLYSRLQTWQGQLPECHCVCEEVSSQETMAQLPADPWAEDRTTIGAPLADTENGEPKGSIGRRWFIYRTRPPHVHALTWRQLAASTRAQHIRWLEAIRAFPDDIARLPLAAAIVEYLQRMSSARGWAFSTLASALSAFGSALEALPIYTNAPAAIAVRRDPVFAATLKRAQHLARVTTVHSPNASLPVGVYQDLLKSLGDPNVRLLLRLAWFYAARVGDMRQITAQDVRPPTESLPTVALTFRFGKGAAFWGPYCVQAVLDDTTAKALAALRASRPVGPLFSLAEQAALSKAIGEAGFNLRTIRRGALNHLAAGGVSDRHLQLLSGHRRVDTLMRYLGWGAASADAAQAAVQRLRASDVLGGGHPHEPAKMGVWSGLQGVKGRRIKRPPSIFGHAPPSAADLGIELPHDDDIRSWPIHMKDVGAVDWDAVRAMAEDTPWREAIETARGWCEDPAVYRSATPGRIYETHEVPFSRITEKDAEEMVVGGKLRHYCGPIRGYAKGFMLPQASKRRRRPIFEPSSNPFFAASGLLQQRYPSRLQRRARARGHPWAHEVDCSAYFDQFFLAPSVQEYYVIKVRTPSGPKLYVLTRLPMGATFAPGVAQAVTWVVAFSLLGRPGVHVDTMIDNIRVVAETRDLLVAALSELQLRLAKVGITTNDGFGHCVVDSVIGSAPSEYTFLGEQYFPTGEVANTAKNLEKLGLALQRLTDDSNVTYRQFASILGLLTWLAHTVNVPMCQHVGLLRAYSRIAAAGGGRWDDTATLAPSVIDKVLRLAAAVLPNTPVPLPSLRPPSFAEADYDAVAYTDASASGWGAVVLDPATGRTLALQQHWTQALHHSATAEPLAVARLLDWAKERGLRRIAIVTDHIALATGQRRWWSNYGGFSTAHALNEAFLRLPVPEGHIFYLPGSENPADALSRDVSSRSYALVERRSNVRLPALGRSWHPYSSDDRPLWCV
ncbi:MAG: hypothetical protein COA68_12285 [Oceanobacter sp.]|nr:MAG: hypothetical protein COA68_12285 [Oceanobacter sp.]